MSSCKMDTLCMKKNKIIKFVTACFVSCSYTWMEPIQDHLYIDKIKNGDTTSYEYIVEKYKHMVYTIAIRTLGNVEDAQDVAQESFIKAYQQLNQFQGNSKFSTWLYTITYRTALSKLKENSIETFSIDDTISEHYIQDHKISQHEEMELKDEQKYVRQAIQNLPKTEALLVTLYYINENSINEICVITGLSYANIKIKLYRARKKLERELQFLIQLELKAGRDNEK